jgi:hypothetical protein
VRAGVVHPGRAPAPVEQLEQADADEGVLPRVEGLAGLAGQGLVDADRRARRPGDDDP